jgi:polyferredoxin
MKLPYYYLVKNANYHILFLLYDLIYAPISSLSQLLCVLVTPSTYVREVVGLNFGLNTGISNWGFLLENFWTRPQSLLYKFFSIHLFSLFGMVSSSYWKRHQVIHNSDCTARYFYSNAFSAFILLSSEIWP